MTGLVPEGLDDAAVAPFISLTVSTLGMLGLDPVIRQYTAAAPQAHRAIRELSGAVAAAGVRVRDSGPRQRDEFEEHVRLFTAEELWLINLAVDVIAMLTGLGGLRPDLHAQAVSDLRSLDYHVHSHHWKAQVRKAGDGPQQFRELRAHVPQHKPRP